MHLNLGPGSHLVPISLHLLRQSTFPTPIYFRVGLLQKRNYSNIYNQQFEPMLRTSVPRWETEAQSGERPRPGIQVSHRQGHNPSKYILSSLASLLIAMGHTAQTSQGWFYNGDFLLKSQAIPLLHKTYMRFAKEVWEQPEALAPQIVHLISKLILDSGSSQPGIAGFNAAAGKGNWHLVSIYLTCEAGGPPHSSFNESEGN